MFLNESIIGFKEKCMNKIQIVNDNQSYYSESRLGVLISTKDAVSMLDKKGQKHFVKLNSKQISRSCIFLTNRFKEVQITNEKKKLVIKRYFDLEMVTHFKTAQLMESHFFHTVEGNEKLLKLLNETGKKYNLTGN